MAISQLLLVQIIQLPILQQPTYYKVVEDPNIIKHHLMLISQFQLSLHVTTGRKRVLRSGKKLKVWCIIVEILQTAKLLRKKKVLMNQNQISCMICLILFRQLSPLKLSELLISQSKIIVAISRRRRVDLKNSHYK